MESAEVKRIRLSMPDLSLVAAIRDLPRPPRIRAKTTARGEGARVAATFGAYTGWGQANGDPVDVEVLLLDGVNCNSGSWTCQARQLEEVLFNLLSKGELQLLPEQPMNEFTSRLVSRQVASIRLCPTTTDTDLTKARFYFHMFQLNREAPLQGSLDFDGEDVPSTTSWILPSAQLQGQWESLVFQTGIKEDLIQFVETVLYLAGKGVDNNIMGVNRVILLHGPPGTGKTSLCRALAHKLAIRNSRRYRRGHLVEVNSHSLFSKWFSESGKLVQRMFEYIHEVAKDSSCLVFVLIDEVESLTSARRNFASGTEPSDSIRAVNALLTQLDGLRNSSNVVVLTTSNITGAIDLAFVDRADMQLYVGPPGQQAIRQILHSCIADLVRHQVVQDDCSLLTEAASSADPGEESGPLAALAEVAQLCCGLSARSVRKLPFLSLSEHGLRPGAGSLPLSTFLEGLQRAANRMLEERAVTASSYSHI